jgi:ABC-type multidrug transport system fused ATPase/permease subunit
MTITQKENETMKTEDDVVIEAMIPTVDTTVDDDGDGITEDAASDSSKTTATTDKQPLRSVTPTVSKIFSLIRTEVPLLVLGLILMVVSEAATLTIPIIVAFAYDALQTYFIDLGTSISSSDSNLAITTENEDAAEVTMSEINLWMGTAVGVFILSQLAGYARGIILGVLGERLVARLRRQVYASVLKQEIGFFDEHKTGEIVSRLGSDTQLLQSAVSTFAPESLIGFVKVIISVVLMYSINAKLTSVALSGMVILCLFGIPFGRRLAALSKRYQDVLGDAQTRSTEALGNIRTVQSFASEPKELSRYTEKIGNPDDNNNSNDGGNKNKHNNDKEKEDTTYDVGVKKQITQVGLYTLVFGGAFGFLYCSLWYGFYLVTIEGSLTLGGMTAFQSYVFIIGAAIGSTVNNLAQLFSAIGASGRVFYLLERQPKIKNYENSNDGENTGNTNKKAIVPTSPMEGNIVFDNVMFS